MSDPVALSEIENLGAEQVAKRSTQICLEWKQSFLENDLFLKLLNNFKERKERLGDQGLDDSMFKMALQSLKHCWYVDVLDAFQKDPNFMKFRFLDLFTPGVLKSYQSLILEYCKMVSDDENSGSIDKGKTELALSSDHFQALEYLRKGFPLHEYGMLLDFSKENMRETLEKSLQELLGVDSPWMEDAQKPQKSGDEPLSTSHSEEQLSEHFDNLINSIVELLPIHEHFKEQAATTTTHFTTAIAKQNGGKIPTELLDEMMKLNKFNGFNEVKLALIFQDHPEWAPPPSEWLPPFSTEEAHIVAKGFYENHQFYEACLAFSALCITSLNNRELLTHLGNCLQKLDQTDLAQMAYSKASRLS